MAAHVIVGSLPGSLELDSDSAHHLASVLRLRPGEAVGATDGRGGYQPCAYAGPGRLEPTGPVVQAEPRQPLLTVGFVPVKGDRPEWVVQKLTELGVDRVVVLQSERSVVRWAGPRAGSHMQRLEKVARSAVMQSRQVWIPAVEGPVGLAEFLRTAAPAGPGAGAGAVSDAGAVAGAAGSVAVAVAQMGGPPPWPGLRAVAVGPEGGWAPAELGAAPAAVGLGPSVLRAETAAVAAGVLLAALRSGTVAPGPGPRP